MSKQNKVELSNEELCATVAKLKFQLLEARFRLLSGQLEKVHLIKHIKKTIAQILTKLASRGYKASIGSHGVTLYNLKDHSVQVITSEQIEKIMEKKNAQEKAYAQEQSKQVKVEAKKPTQGVLKEVKKEQRKEKE